MSMSDGSSGCMNNSRVNNSFKDSEYWIHAPIPSASSCSVVSDPQKYRRTLSVGNKPYQHTYQRKTRNKTRCNAKTNKIKIDELENEISNIKIDMNNLHKDVSKIASIGNAYNYTQLSPVSVSPNGEGFGGKRSRRRRRKSVKRKRKQSKKNHRKTRR